MRKQIILVSFILSIVTTPLLAAESVKEENIGVAAGVVIGGLIAGPVGAIIGAATGVKVGDSFHRKQLEVDALSGSLQGSRNRVSDLEATVNDLDGELNRLGLDLQAMQSAPDSNYLDLLQAGIEMDVLFRTNEDVLVTDTAERLHKLAGIITSMPGVSIQLDGFADERGDVEYNQQLSSRRATYVRDLLLAGGISADRIAVFSHGESPAIAKDSDSYALQRRVSLRLFVSEESKVAANP